MMVMVLLFAVLAALPAPAAAADLWVTGSGSDSTGCLQASNPCQTVGYAVLQSSDGDAINVMTGTYTDPVQIRVPRTGLRISGGWNCSSIPCTQDRAHPEWTTLDGSGWSDPPILINATGTTGIEVVVDNLTIKNSFAGGGITAWGDATGFVHLTVQDSVVADNVNQSNGGGIEIGGRDIELSLLRNTIQGNRAPNGGGVHVQCGTDGLSTATVTLLDNLVEGNDATSVLGGTGGGVNIVTGPEGCALKATFAGNVIGASGSPNTATQAGGGVSIVRTDGANASFLFERNVIQYNTAVNSGAGLYLSAEQGTVVGSIVENNILFNGGATLTKGGGFYVNTGVSAATLDISDNSIQWNDAVTGAGIYAESASQLRVDLRGNELSLNGTQVTGSGFRLTVTGGIASASIARNNIAYNSRGLDFGVTGGTASVKIENSYVVDSGDMGIASIATGGTLYLSVLNSTVANNGKNLGFPSGYGFGLWAITGGIAEAGLVNSVVVGNRDYDLFVSEDSGNGSKAHTILNTSDYVTFDDSGVSSTGGGLEETDVNYHVDPLFVDPANGNFRLQLASPMVDHGVCDSTWDRWAPLVDFDADPRPPSPEPNYVCDIGADEIDYCEDGEQNWDEQAVDCGGDRCVPCACTTGDHARMICGVFGNWVEYADIATAYSTLSDANTCTIEAHRMEFDGIHRFTRNTASGQPLAIRITGGRPCGWGLGGLGTHTTIQGKVVVGGDVVFEANGLAIR